MRVHGQQQQHVSCDKLTSLIVVLRGIGFVCWGDKGYIGCSTVEHYSFRRDKPGQWSPTVDCRKNFVTVKYITLPFDAFKNRNIE